LLKEGGIRMPRRITEDCISSGACVAECPVDCITEGEDIYVIDEDACIDCGACEVVCPVEAIIEV
jgi:NAD-dependent dihydropyrimidine dehydrogenase PreA subunit